MGRKKKKKRSRGLTGIPGGIPPPPLPPPPGGSLPPPPGAADIPPPPDAEDDGQDGRGLLSAAAAPLISGLAPPDMSEEKKTGGYDSLWKRGSSKPLQQVYGHIDRLGEGEVGSLLERYADRFGHQLDREIIVKRREEHVAKVAELRDAPTIELLDQEDEEESVFEDEEEPEVEQQVEEVVEDEADLPERLDDLDLDDATISELRAKKQRIEASIKKLKPKYKLAKQKKQAGKLAKLKPKLESLMEEYRSLKAVLDGEAPLLSLEEVDDSPEDDQFLDFVAIVDNLLVKLPDPDAFIQSDSFDLYAQVAGDPEAADAESRSAFFSLVDSLLIDLPEDEIVGFTQSEEFQVYSEIGARYGS